ncbi:MAG: AAA family ATPase [Methyloligellaceae bacterium]
MSTNRSRQGARSRANGCDEQDAVIAFLSEPSSYDPAPPSVQRIDTHAAVVFLAGEEAYKIKRAVKLPYLDFSTLEKRRLVCEREVELNRATAPQLYLGVIPIVRRQGGGFSLGGDGSPVEWAVKMSRFDQACLFDRLAHEGKLDVALMAPLAEHIAGFHAKASVAIKADGEAAMSSVVTSTIAALGSAADAIPQRALTYHAVAVLHALRSNAELLRQRSADGHVRRCHGDLHLKNIVLLSDGPVLFDAIEFDEALATIDVLYDLAFLIMDLWHNGLRRHANAVLNRYLTAAGDADNFRALSALPLFLACRAAVRAMVTLDSLPHLAPLAGTSAQHEAADYFGSAQAFLFPDTPRLIAIGGLSGTGKSTLGAALAPSLGAAPGAIHLRSDVERKAMFGVPEGERLDTEAYAPAITERVYKAMADKAGIALQAGHSVILDAVSLTVEHRRMFESVAQRAGVPFSGLWLNADPERLVQRVEARTGDASDADAGVVRQQLALPTGPVSWRVVKSDADPDATLRAAARAVHVALA